MLILTRREREVVRIGTDIRITVERIDGDRVRLGFVAPREVRIVREELIDRGREAERRDA
jgi:carbon storage regulator